MTEQESIKSLKEKYPFELCDEDEYEMAQIAIKALEKQIAKEPITYKNTNLADCPICKATVRGIKNKFGDWCSGCGQKLDWSKEDGRTN